MTSVTRSFVAIDVETTGIDLRVDSIIQIGAVQFQDGEVVRELNSLVRPLTRVPLKVQRMTGIPEEVALAAPPLDELAPRILEFVGDKPLVAHNAPFDISFIAAGLERCGTGRLSNRVYDTLDLARVVRPSSASFRLERLAREMDIGVERLHDALADAATAGRVFLALFGDLRRMDSGLLEYLHSLASMCGWELADVFGEAAAFPAPAEGGGARRRRKGTRPGRGTLPPAAFSLAAAPDGSGQGENDGRLVGDERVEYAPVSPEYVENILGKQGALSRAMSSFEFRPQQLQMGYLVAEALSEGKHLLAEAGTGIGKSIAYLVPAAAFARANGSRVVVSTHTINLQEQLCTRDIPLLKERLGIDLNHALLKGRSNYICLRRWQALSSRVMGRPLEEVKMIARLAVWLRTTQSGDKSELGLAAEQEGLWDAVASDSDSCEGQSCVHAGSCFFQAARGAASRADIVIANHSLVLSDAALGNKVLPEYSHIVFDEAHNLEKAASEHFGESASTRQVERLLTCAYRGGLLDRLERALARSPGARAHQEPIAAARAAASSARELLEPVASFNIRDIKRSSAGEQGEVQPRAVRLRESQYDDERLTTFRSSASKLSEALDRVAKAVSDVARIADGASWEEAASGGRRKGRRGAGELLRDLALDARRTAAGLSSAARVIASVAGAASQDRVYWLEMDRGNRPGLVFRSAPVDAGPLLRRYIFDRVHSAVLTSATLTVDGSFDYLRSRLGLGEDAGRAVVCESIGSPFDHARQALVCVPSGLPTPKEGEGRFTEAVGLSLTRLAEATRGRMLVLFTSNKMMRTVYHKIKSSVESMGICLLAQGIDGSRTRLIEELRDGSETVLFGSQSFWEGVDVVGPALSCVAIVKLPFSPPDDPMVEARMEHLQRGGANPFSDLLVPEAVLRFKQGFGRLIRSKGDRGVVVVFDRRVLPGHSNYGDKFLGSLPGPSVTTGSEDELLEKISEWLLQS